MSALSFTAEITPDQKLKWLGATRETVVQMVAEAYPNGTIEVTFRKKARKRTSPQNAYYFGVVLQIIFGELQNIGNDDIKNVDQLHEWFKNKYLPPIPIRDREGLILGHLPPTTTKENTVEFWQYVEKVVKWGTEKLNIYIPPPPEKESHF